VGSETHMGFILVSYIVMPFHPNLEYVGKAWYNVKI